MTLSGTRGKRIAAAAAVDPPQQLQSAMNNGGLSAGAAVPHEVRHENGDSSRKRKRMHSSADMDGESMSLEPTQNDSGRLDGSVNDMGICNLFVSFDLANYMSFRSQHSSQAIRGDRTRIFFRDSAQESRAEDNRGRKSKGRGVH